MDDAKLTANGVSFVAQTFRAIPLNNVPTAGPSYFVGLGQMYDGLHNAVNNSSSAPFQGSPISSSVLASFLTDGINGLDMGTGLANIPAGSVLQFNLGASGISASAIGDGVPDILFVQIADPSSNGDRMKFVNSSGQTVGTEFVFNLNNSYNFPRLANWMADFYNPNSTQTTNSFINTQRPIAMLALDLSQLGINSSNYTNVTHLVYTTSGESDPAFVAFNEPSVNLPTRLGIVNQPYVYRTNQVMNPSFEVRLLNSFNQPVLQSNVAVTVTVETGNGTISGTVTRYTDANGVAHFDDLSLSGNNTHTVRFGSSSLTDVVSDPIVWTSLLPVRWGNFAAAVQGSVVELKWSTLLEQHTQDFVVEHSTNGQQFSAVGTVAANGFSSGISNYQFKHAGAVNGTNYYRLVQRDLNGKSSYSATVRIQFNAQDASFKILGNPVIGRQLRIESNARTTVQVYNSAGLLMATKELVIGKQVINLPNWASGIYYVRTPEQTTTVLLQ